MAVADSKPDKVPGIDLTLHEGTWVLSPHSIPIPPKHYGPSPCTVTDTLFNADHGGDVGFSVGVFAAANQRYAVNSQASWIHITSHSSQGNGTVFFNVDPNPGAPRTGTFTICRQTVTVDQA